jgi:signal transduction histidine kinase
MSNVLYKGNMIIPFNDDLICLDPETFEIIKKVPLKNTGGVRCFVVGHDQNLYIGSNKGIFVLDSNLRQLWHLDKQNGLPDECIYSLEVDKDNMLWCSSNKGIFKINPDRSILHLKKENGLQENEFNTNVSSVTPDGELFFGGINGISSFYPEKINPSSDPINIFFTSIKVNNEDLAIDTGLWKIEKIELPYSRNSLAIDYIAMGPDNPDQYIYQYKMQGVDEEWIANSDMQSTKYFLQPGRYVFQVYASKLFDKNAMPLKELIIIINPPFWKTWWFVIGMILITGIVLAFNINRFNKKKYARQLRALEDERQLKLERERISRDLHDSLGAYANAVLYNTELLQQENNNVRRDELIKDLRFASKDIITSLRETIWALNKENFTVKDCLVRIRNFIQPFNRYYNHIQFRVEGDAPDELVLHATKALHLVRIIQEAVSNSIKHAEAKNIVVTSSEQNGNWKLEVTDDGKGFDFITTKKEERGNGLSNMEQRTHDAGFEMIIDSIPGTGTTLTIIISPASGLVKKGN